MASTAGGALCACIILTTGCDSKPKPTAQAVGQQILFDASLSAASNQACADCHGDSVGGTGPDEAINVAGAVYEGSVAGRFGNRKPPATNYATLAPLLTIDADGTVRGGNFWDGRATGWLLGLPAIDQAQGPFLNPLEQALPSGTEVVTRVCQSEYAPAFRAVAGTSACNDPTQGFDAVAQTIAAYEGSPQLNAFSSKLDAFRAGHATLSPAEALGLSLFEGKAGCNRCHPSEPGPNGEPPAFTDFTFDNLGVPRNPQSFFYAEYELIVDGAPVNPLGRKWVHEGLGGFLATLTTADDWRAQPFVPDAFRTITHEALEQLAAQNRGKQRVPTLRNVDKRPAPTFVKAYTHNGWFKSLASLVHFYNTRDVLPACPSAFTTEEDALAQGCWPPPEIEETVNREELGHLGLSADEEAALVAFLGTLSDGWSPSLVPSP